MSTVSQPMTRLFSAFFEDGTVIKQTQEDKSATEESKSQFFDVLEKQKESRLVQMSLVSGDDELLIVDLNVGRFYANGIDFSVEDRDEPLTDRKIIYLRECLQHSTAEDGVQEPYISEYLLGYEGKNEKGRNVQRVIRLRA